MIQLETANGTIDISQHYFTTLIGHTVNQCFGVVGMATAGKAQTLRNMLPYAREIERGVRVRAIGKRLVIDLHIIASYGMNLNAICKSIAHEVKYTVEEATGLRVARVNVYVDEMRA